MKYLYRHTRAFRRVLGRSKKFKKGIFRTEEGGVVEHERYQAPLKINEVFSNALTASLFTVFLLFSTVSKQKRGWAKTSFRVQKKTSISAVGFTRFPMSWFIIIKNN